MNADSHHGSRRSTALGPALIALALSAVAIGSILALSPETRGSHAVVATAPSAAGDVAATSAPNPTTIAGPTTVAITTMTSPATMAFAPLAVGAPTIRAKAYAVYDVTGKQWLAESQADQRLPVGSIMKMLTAYVVLQAGNLSKVVTVPVLHLNVAESAIGLSAGERLTRDELLRAMLVVSAGDAAETLAIDVGGTADAFVQQMNAAARQLGLASTVAGNPVGLDQTIARSTARDMITLATVLMQNASFRQIVAQTSVTLHGKTYPSTDKLLAIYPGADGVKTGHTTHAGYCVVSSVTRNGRAIMVAVLGAPSDNARFSDARALLDWAFAH
ncbi:MAG: D-alanyl-D-alanine carboxypeptidase family protein [Ilumatobacteraceae bacterium]